MAHLSVVGLLRVCAVLSVTPGAHTQGESLDELQANLREVVELLLADGEPKLETEFVGT